MRNRLTKLTILFILFVMLISMGSVCSAATEDPSNDYQKEVTREEIKIQKPAISAREATISMLLNAGWTMEEIEDWYTEETLLELDKNAKAVSNNALYTVNYENADTEEVTSVELTRQEFEYGVNQVECQQEDHDNTQLSGLSSSGVLELQPIYGWGSMDYVTANDRIYYGYENYSGASIYNADSTCYLKQNMGMVWMSNDIYVIQYRYEWMTEPSYRIRDTFAVGLATDLMIADNPSQSFTFKYSLLGTDYEEKVTSTSTPSTYCSMKEVGGKQGRQVIITWPTVPMTDVATVSAINLKGFLSFKAKINNKYDYTQFITYAQYYHGTLDIYPNVSVGFSSSGLDGTFSINASFAYKEETHPMEVRAYNIYTN